jgi:predicted TIM-barrel fold metal-dependent hydrolase
VLDHVGGPLGIRGYAGKREEVFADWKRSMTELAGCPNVHVKLGGLGMRINGFGFEDAAEPPSSDTLAAAWKPWIETTI